MSIQKHWRDIVSIFALLVLSFFAWRVLLSPGFFSMHDGQQIVRLSEMDNALATGQFPVRWIENLGFGYGYPLFNFYPPLTYYLGEAFHLGLKLGFIDATKLVWFVSLFGSSITMYFLSRQFFGRLGGIISGLFYLYAPYHAVDAYVRGALAELFSFVWLPLILLSSYKAVAQKSWRWSVATGIFLGLLMITHPLIFLPFLGFFIIWGLFFVIKENQKLSSLAIGLIVPLILAAGLSAFFWLPQLSEKKYTLVDQLLIKSLASYEIHFVCPSQLWQSAWGFGGSVAGCVDGMSFRLGKVHLVAVIFGLIVGTYYFLKKKNSSATLLFFVSLLFAASVFMTIPASKFIWDSVAPLWYLQFPWRFLEFTALFSSLLAGSIVVASTKPVIKTILIMGMATGLLVVNAKLFTPQELYSWANDTVLTSPYESKWAVSSTSFEYMFKDTTVKKTDLGTITVDIGKATIATDKFVSLEGDFTVQKSNFTADKFSLTGSGSKTSILRININYFPGWKVWIDGEETAIVHDNHLSLITISVPAGLHVITGRFTNTGVRQIGNALSLATILALIVINYRSIVWRNLKRKTHEN